MKEDIKIEKHFLVTKHILLSDEEALKVLAKFNVSLTQLPKILKKDPAIRHLDVKQGNIIKIIRKSETVGDSVYYRTVYD